MPTTTPNAIFFADSSTSMSAEAISAAEATSVQNALDSLVNDNRQIQTFRWDDSADRNAQTGMVAGDQGYQVDTGAYYTYSGTQWDEQTESVLSRVSSPTVSVTGAGSSATVNSDGSISIVAATAIALDNFMTEDFSEYQVRGLASAVTAAGDIQVQMRTAVPATISSGIYGYWFQSVTGTGTTSASGNAGTANNMVLGRADGAGRFDLSISGAMLTQDTLFFGRSVEQSFLRTAGGVVNSTTAYPGILITFTNTGAWTGTLRIEKYS